MKKVFFLSTLLLLPVFAFATSGACSGHGGVNCSAGPDSDGSVICNDSWRNSSVSYSSMVMCANYSVPEKETEPQIVPVPAPPVVKPIIKEAVAPKPAIVNKIQPPKAVKKVEVKPEVKQTNPEPQKIDKPLPQKKVGFWARVFGFVF